MRATSGDVRAVTASDVDPLAHALARSFHDDPITSWLVPNDERRVAQLVPFYRAELRAAGRQGLALTTTDAAGAALWFPPGRWRLPARELLRAAPALVRAFRVHLVDGLRFLSKVEAVHPREPHWYLGILGTDPVHQGKGVGGALISEVIGRCDEEGLGAYLESSKPQNLPYYERFGFRVTDEVTVPGAPPVWGMWREPNAP